MTTCFDLWEQDPFFSAAEEVQESTDRMQSVYRRWIRERDESPNPDTRRELHTALGTAKWQLDELERAVKSSDTASSAGQDTVARHNQFVEAIGNQISTVENSLKEFNAGEGKPAPMSWVRLDEAECDELAVFLQSEKSPPLPPLPRPLLAATPPVGEFKSQSPPLKMNGENSSDASSRLEERAHGHRRTASATPVVESWNIVVTSEDDSSSLTPRKAPSFSCLAKVLDSTPNMKLPKNVFGKWKGGDKPQEEETIPLSGHQVNSGLIPSYERNKSYLSSYSDGSYDKQLYGWVGVIHRQLQRSQYQFQYGHPIPMMLWTILVIFLIGLVLMS